MSHFSFSKLKLYYRVIIRKIRTRFIYIVQARKISNHPVEILFIASSYIPTLQLSFLKPLEKLAITYYVLTEVELKDIFGKEVRGKPAEKFFIKKIAACHPKLIIFCRYNGPHAEKVLTYCRATNVPTVFHIDDDLLNVPIELGIKKYEYHNDPLRRDTVKLLLSKTDLVYCSNTRLIERFKSLGFQNNFYAGKIYAAANILNEPSQNNPWKLGYMGFDHEEDFALVVPTLIKLLDHYPLLTFDLFGPIKLPEVLRKFGSRVQSIEPIASYAEFMNKLASLKWAVAICPLTRTPFNEVKSNTKWVEYTSVGAAVVATKHMIYDDCCSNDCGVLTENNSWYEAISGLLENNERRYLTAKNAQKKLLREYKHEILSDQILQVKAMALESLSR